MAIRLSLAGSMLLDGVNHRLLRGMQRVGLVKRRLDPPGGPQPVGELAQVGTGQRKRVVVAEFAFDDCGGSRESGLRQKGALHTQLGRAAEVHALGVVAFPGKLHQTARVRSGDAHAIDQGPLVVLVEFADAECGAERALRARIVEPALGLQPDGGARHAALDLGA